VFLDVRTAYPIAFCFQTLYKMATDKSPGAAYENTFALHTNPLF